MSQVKVGVWFWSYQIKAAGLELNLGSLGLLLSALYFYLYLLPLFLPFHSYFVV